MYIVTVITTCWMLILKVKNFQSVFTLNLKSHGSKRSVYNKPDINWDYKFSVLENYRGEVVKEVEIILYQQAVGDWWNVMTPQLCYRHNRWSLWNVSPVQASWLIHLYTRKGHSLCSPCKRILRCWKTAVL